MKGFRYCNQASSCRGALRHWLIGCGVVLLVLIGLLAGGGFFLFKKVAPKTFSTATKMDLPPTADKEQILPEKAGAFRRVAFDGASLMQGNLPTTGSVVATYEEPEGGKLATVMAIGSEEMKQAQKDSHPAPGLMMNPKDQPEDMGISLKIPFGPQKMEMAMWGKKNWAYIVQTTNTSALEFAKEFYPGGAPKPADQATTGTEEQTTGTEKQ